MNTMPLKEIVGKLTAIASLPNDDTQQFLQEFTTLIEESLMTDGRVTIKGIGTFVKTAGNDGEPTVDFRPDIAVSEAVNAPFAMFEAIELADGMTQELLDAEADNTDSGELAAETATETEIPPQAEPPRDAEEDQTPTITPPATPPSTSPAKEKQRPSQTAEHTPDPVTVPSTHPTPTPEPEPVAPTKTPPVEKPIQPEAASAPTTPPATPQTPPPSPPRIPSRERPLQPKVVEKERVVKVVERRTNIHATVLAALLALLIGLIGGYFAYGWLNLGDVKSVKISAEDVHVVQRGVEHTPPVTVIKERAANTDSLQPDATPPAATEPVPAVTVVTDTVAKGKFLATIARKHYGKAKFWVYIYEENRDKISDPDNVPPMTVVVVPPPEKYGIKAGDPASEADAEKRARDILAAKKR